MEKSKTRWLDRCGLKTVEVRMEEAKRGWRERGHEVSGHLKRGYGGRGWRELVSVWDCSEKLLKAEVQIELKCIKVQLQTKKL